MPPTHMPHTHVCSRLRGHGRAACFTLSARLVDGGWRGPVSDAKGRVRSGLGRSTGLGAVGVPGRRRGQGSESSQTQLAVCGVVGAGHGVGPLRTFSSCLRRLADSRLRQRSLSLEHSGEHVVVRGTAMWSGALI